MKTTYESPEIDALRYPIGRYTPTQAVSLDEARQHVDTLAALPAKLTALVQGWSDEQLDTPYRPNGWTVRQLVHHVADSHINVYTRTKLALTETNPTIRPYDETAWAELADSQLPVGPSLDLLAQLHLRWTTLLRSLPDAAFSRTFYHPGMQQTFTLADMTGLYVWHGEHHYQHAARLAERNGWH